MKPKAVIVLYTLLAGAIILAASHTRGTTEMELNGLPITFNLVADTTDAGGRRIVYRSQPLALCASDDANLMNSPGYPGSLGIHDGVAWIYTPDDRTLSVFPGHVVNETPVPSDWQSLVMSYLSQHPDCTIVGQDQTVWRKADDGGWYGASGFQSVPQPVDCAPAVSHPYCIEYSGVFSGDVAAFVPPPSVVHMVYRVPFPPH